MTRTSLQPILQTAIKAAKSATQIHLKYQNRPLKTKRKQHYDIVTQADTEAETQILEIIRHDFPNHSIKSEELGEINSDSPWKWVIDPLDGTINFAAGLPLFGVSIAAQKDEQTQVGVMQVPLMNLLYTTTLDDGAWLNHKKIRCSSTKKLADAILSITLTSHYQPYHFKLATNIIKTLAPKVRGLRIIVGQVIELGWVASGKLDAQITVKSGGIGSASGRLLIQEAGGQATDLQGKPSDNTSTSLVASNGHLHQQLLKVIKPSL